MLRYLRNFLFAAQSCLGCGHLRTSHSRIGCMERGCGCSVKYMDKDNFR